MSTSVLPLPWRALRTYLSPAQRAARRTLEVIAQLEQEGCRVLSAQAIGKDGPSVHIATPPSGLMQSYGFRQPPPCSVRVPCLCVAMREGVRVQWYERR